LPRKSPPTDASKNSPGKDDQRRQRDPDQRAQLAQPAGPPVGDQEAEDGRPDDERQHRPLDQDSDPDRGPERQRAAEADPRPAHGRARPAPQIGGGERRLGDQDRGEEGGVCLGEPRLHPHHERAGDHDPRRQPHRRPEQQGTDPAGRHRADERAEKRGQPIGPDGRRRIARHRRDGGDRRRLEPVDPDRLLVARLLLEADVDEVARLQHLLRRLGEASLVAVGDREQGEAGQERREADERDQGRAAQRQATGHASRPFLTGSPADRPPPHARASRAGSARCS
jgi:hypothetical protein